MDPKEVMDQINKIPTLDSINQSVSKTVNDQVTALLSDWNDKLKVTIDGVKVPAVVEPKPTATAEMAESGILAGINKIDVMGVPVGQALVGGFAATFATELIDGFLATQSTMVTGVVKLGGAFVALKWGKKIMGDTGSKAAAILLTFDAIRDILPIDTYAKKAAGMLSGVLPSRGLAQGARTISLRPANSADYYSRALGR